MQVTKSNFYLAACGIQLDNGVTPPCKQPNGVEISRPSNEGPR